MMIFVPLSVDELRSWAEAGRFQPASAYAVTPSMSAAFGFGPADTEDAEHTVLHIAGLAALLRGGRRLVAVAEGAGSPVSGAEFGDVRVGELPYTAVTALFGDPETPGVRALGERVAGSTLGTAWDDPAVAELLADNELSWHGPTEWRALLV